MPVRLPRQRETAYKLGLRTLPMSCAPPERPATPEELDLLRKHRPLLQYSQDPFRISSARTIVDTDGNALHRLDGSTVAVGAGLSLDSLLADADPGEYLVATAYSDIKPPPLQEDPAYANRVYGRVVDDGPSGKWLQYWFWIYFNQKRLLGYGSHEGDWEMIQIHLDASGEPDRVTFAQHDHGDARRWGADHGMRLQHGTGANEPSSLWPRSRTPRTTARDEVLRRGHRQPRRAWPAGALRGRAVRPVASWPGRWGGSRARMGTSPHGPACQGTKRANPNRYHVAPEGTETVAAAPQGRLGGGSLYLPAQAKRSRRRSTARSCGALSRSRGPDSARAAHLHERALHERALGGGQEARRWTEHREACRRVGAVRV